MAGETGAMEVDAMMNVAPHPFTKDGIANGSVGTSCEVSPPPQPPIREMYRQLPVRVHVRRPGRDTWLYIGHAIVSHEVTGQTSRVVVRDESDKVLTIFGEQCDLQTERRGNFVVVACVEAEGVLSWSLNAVNMKNTLELLASIELACYRSKQLFLDPKRYTSSRRKIERIIRDDRRKRHRRKRDEEAMVSAFGKQKLG
ncbi:hypothetical protein K439DRAFT_1384601 [Ramaria rubella]|nr:hypothetical protein K439DRAFT_1384601 [Ramaria rubella]